MGIPWKELSLSQKTKGREFLSLIKPVMGLGSYETVIQTSTEKQASCHVHMKLALWHRRQTTRVECLESED